MSKTPIFKHPKIKYQNTKHRKDFILDMLFVNIGISVLYVALFENFEDGVKPLHKNKNRKELAKIKETYDFFVEHRNKIYEFMEYKDIQTLKHKLQKTGPDFIKKISLSEKDMNLETLAISILRNGLSRENRKTPLHERLKVFRNFKIHKKTIDLVKKAAA